MSDSYRYHAFISFGGNESFPLASRICSRLAAEDFSVWLDERELNVGDRIDDTIHTALEQSHTLVCVVNRRWFESDYAQRELRTFILSLGSDGRRREIFPVLVDKGVEPQLARVLGEYGNVKAIEWAWRDFERTEALERLIEQLHKRFPLRQRPATSVLPPGGDKAQRRDRSRSATHWGSPRRCLTLDRDYQWGSLAGTLSARRHARLFVLGPSPEAPERFLDRIREFAPTYAPAARTRNLNWPQGPPANRGGYLAALARALECDPSDRGIDRALRAFLAEEDLILIHRPVLSADEASRSLKCYHCEWLPKLLASIGATRGTMRVVQAFDWRPRPLAARPAASRVPRELDRFLDQVEAAPASWIFGRLLLAPRVEPGDLERWLKENEPQLSASERKRTAQRIFRRAHTSDEVFDELIQWVEAQEATA